MSKQSASGPSNTRPRVQKKSPGPPRKDSFSGELGSWILPSCPPTSASVQGQENSPGPPRNDSFSGELGSWIFPSFAPTSASVQGQENSPGPPRKASFSGDFDRILDSPPTSGDYDWLLTPPTSPITVQRQQKSPGPRRKDSGASREPEPPTPASVCSRETDPKQASLASASVQWQEKSPGPRRKDLFSPKKDSKHPAFDTSGNSRPRWKYSYYPETESRQAAIGNSGPATSASDLLQKKSPGPRWKSSSSQSTVASVFRRDTEQSVLTKGKSPGPRRKDFFSREQDSIPCRMDKEPPPPVPCRMDKEAASSASPPRWKYDVFLSYRHGDSPTNFLPDLYHRLQERGITTFMDDSDFQVGDDVFPSLLKDDSDLQVGDDVSPSLLKAIEGSRFAIVVLSQNYASSAWCLEQLTKICQIIENGRRILPVFYHVDPSDVRHQAGSFQDAFAKHESSVRNESEKVKQWRDALTKMANLSGWDTRDYDTEAGVVEAIVESVYSKLQPVVVSQSPDLTKIQGTLARKPKLTVTNWEKGDLLGSGSFGSVYEGITETDGQHIEAIAEFVFIETEGDFQAFEATRRAMGEVMKALEADEVTTIGVYGMQGVGKTTMVEHVSAKVRDNGMFHHVISAVVSNNPDLRKIQGTLADMLGFILEEETEIGRARRLMQRIRRGNRILIILDNIWESTDLSHIGIPSYHELRRCNSKVLLITRTENVCDAMGCQPNISLDVLSDKDSWALFENKARMSFDLITFRDVAKEVAGACAGLPVALIAVVKALDNKCLDDWKVAAQRLARPANLKYEKVVFNCIKLSYDYLRSDDARSCFLLCCLFPEDYDIQIEDLLKYGMGKGLFQDSSTMHDARASAYSVVKYLKDCGLLLKSEQDGCVKMHDAIRDVAILIAKDDPLFLAKAGCQLKEWPSISAHEGYSAISLIRNKICKLPEELVCPKLLILFLQSNVWLNEIPEYFFQSSNVLMVLDLSRTRISFLPTSFNSLINLQTLYLDGCFSTIDNISVLGKLKKLEILSMRELPLVELPKEIGDLSHLRMLDITGDYVDNVPSEVICNLSFLEELYMQCNFADWGGKVEGAGEENIVAFDELTGLSHLNVLKVFISDAKCLPKNVKVEPNWGSFDICISRDPSIRKVSLISSSSPALIKALTLDTTINALPDWFINAVTMNTEKLQYIMCRGLDNIIVEYDHGRLHALKYLSVIGPNENMKVLMNTVTRFWNEPVFQNLEELHLVQVDCLKELCVGELPPGSLCNLRLLKVKHCYELVDALLQSGLLQRLQNLEKVICEEIDELEYVFGCEGLKPEQMILTQLKEMRLENLGRLIKIWNGPAPCAIFQNLLSLVVSGCNKLKNLFLADVAQCLLHLKDISVELCLILDNVIEASKETVDNKIVFPKLKNLALIKLPQLTRFCGSSGCVIECPLLEYLYVERCPQFPFSPFDFHSGNQVKLNHPQHLDIVQRREQRR